jgi:hypothetical protein
MTSPEMLDANTAALLFVELLLELELFFGLVLLSESLQDTAGVRLIPSSCVLLI